MKPTCPAVVLAAAFIFLPAGIVSAETIVGNKPAVPNAPAATTPPAAAPVATPEVENGYLKLGFEQLASYQFTPPAFDPAADPKAKPPTGEEQIPATVKSWNGKKAMITGYMVPVKMDQGLVTEFLLMRNTMACCFGTVPNMNEWVIVKMKKGVQPMMDVPVAFYGQLKVGAMFENGYMTGLYELEGERMGEVQG
jgi:hypothetical protein